MAIMTQTWGEWYDANLKDWEPSDPRSAASFNYYAMIIAAILNADTEMSKHPVKKPIKRKLIKDWCL